MELSELTAYAREKYQMEEQHKWSGFPGFSVLCHPDTGKWVALLMRQWDTETGEELQCCDLKCGSQGMIRPDRPYLSAAVRMKGRNWTGVAFGPGTDPDVVFRLLDDAVAAGAWRGCTVVLEEPGAREEGSCRETPLPFPGGITRGFPPAHRAGSVDVPAMPDRIREMTDLYEPCGGTLSGKARNFLRQGRFMEDYEDDAPWDGVFMQYFPTYHDLNLRQLRGYFTWRTRLRKGEFLPIATSLAYIYLYELLNGIGVRSPEEALDKMRKFEEGWLASGAGDPGMRKNLRKWMFEYAVLHGLPPETAAQYASPAVLERDDALAVLKNPKQHTEEEIFSALCVFGGKALTRSPVLSLDSGKRLFGGVWRELSQRYRADQKGVFTACFGKRRTYRWHPLANAVYDYGDQAAPDRDYDLTACTTYRLRSGSWHEVRYESLYFNKTLFQGILHGTDCILRRHCRTGRYLRERPEEAWLTPYVTAAIEAERQAEAAAEQERITIDFSSLTRIRREALVTRDSLLTEEETEGDPVLTEAEEPAEELAAAAEPEDPAEPAAEPEEPSGEAFAGLDALHLRILTDLLRGLPAEDLIKSRRLMPSVVADTVNGALFDEIGDNILECDGDRITLIEDYREEVLEILGGRGHE